MQYDDDPEDAKPTAMMIAMAEATRKAREKEKEMQQQPYEDNPNWGIGKRVFEYIKHVKGPIAASSVAKALGLTPQQAYGALFGVAKRGGAVKSLGDGGVLAYTWSGKELDWNDMTGTARKVGRPPGRKDGKPRRSKKLSQVVTQGEKEAPPMTSEIKLVIGGRTMPMEEARKLYDQLHAIFGGR